MMISDDGKSDETAEIPPRRTRRQKRSAQRANPRRRKARARLGQVVKTTPADPISPVNPTLMLWDIVDITLPQAAGAGTKLAGRITSLEPFLVQTVHGVITDAQPEWCVRRGVRLATLKPKQEWKQ